MSELELQVSTKVEQMRKDRDLRPEAICAAANFSRASYYVRLNSGGWRLAELEGLARFFDTSLADLLTSESVSAWTRTTRHLWAVAA